MSEQDWTPEPWRVSEPAPDGWQWPAIYTMAGSGIAEFGGGDMDTRRANARRAAVCVNATAGISTEDLERPGFLERARLYTRPLKDLEEAKRLLLALAHELGGVGLHNSEYGAAVLAFFGVEHYAYLPELER